MILIKNLYSKQIFYLLILISCISLAIFIKFRSYEKILFFDNFISAFLKDRISKNIDNLTEIEKYRIIKNISSKFMANGIANCHFECQKPLAKIQTTENRELIFTDGAIFIESQMYNPDFISKLPTITYAEKYFENNIKLLEFILRSDNNFFYKYKVNWYSANKIELIELSCPNLKIITNLETFINKELLNFAEKIFISKNSKAMLVDIRFRDYIIIA